EKTSVGYRWTHTYSANLTFPDGTHTNVHYSDGDADTFTLANNVWTAPAGNYDTLVTNGNGTYTLTNPKQVKFNFSSAGKLTIIVDSNSNTTPLTYDGNRYLTTIPDPGSRTLSLTNDTSGRITLITDPLSRTVGFSYDSNGDLATATDVKSGT